MKTRSAAKLVIFSSIVLMVAWFSFLVYTVLAIGPKIPELAADIVNRYEAAREQPDILTPLPEEFLQDE